MADELNETLDNETAASESIAVDPACLSTYIPFHGWDKDLLILLAAKLREASIERAETHAQRPRRQRAARNPAPIFSHKAHI